MSVNEKMTAIADAIREKTGKTNKLSLDAMAEEISGISAGERDINPEWTDWRYFCYNDNRNDLVGKLRYSDTSNGTNFFNMFYNCTNLTSIPAIDTSNGTRFDGMFESCLRLTSIPELDTSKGTSFEGMFYRCVSLTSIPKLDTSNGTRFNGMFNSCGSLVDLNIVGTINATGLDVSHSILLSHKSLMSIINALADKTGVSGTFKVTLGSTNLAKLTAEEIAIAEGKGWTLA